MCIYIYRDLAPLAGGGLPADQQDGALGWTRFALLIVTGFIIPANLPRKYTPADPEVYSVNRLHREMKTDGLIGRVLESDAANGLANSLVPVPRILLTSRSDDLQGFQVTHLDH